MVRWLDGWMVKMGLILTIIPFILFTKIQNVCNLGHFYHGTKV